MTVKMSDVQLILWLQALCLWFTGWGQNLVDGQTGEPMPLSDGVPVFSLEAS